MTADCPHPLVASHWCRHCPIKFFWKCTCPLPPARNVRPRLTKARPQPAAEQQHPAPASEDPALWDPLEFDMQLYDEQPAQEAGARQLNEQPARGAGASQPDRQQQQQQLPPPDYWTAEQPCLVMQTDIEQAPDQQALVLDPVTGNFEAAHLPRASLDQPSDQVTMPLTTATLRGCPGNPGTWRPFLPSCRPGPEMNCYACLASLASASRTSNGGMGQSSMPSWTVLVPR